MRYRILFLRHLNLISRKLCKALEWLEKLVETCRRKTKYFYDNCIIVKCIVGLDSIFLIFYILLVQNGIDSPNVIFWVWSVVFGVWINVLYLRQRHNVWPVSLLSLCGGLHLYSGIFFALLKLFSAELQHTLISSLWFVAQLPTAVVAALLLNYPYRSTRGLIKIC
jgi:hypothetical protein